MVIQRAIEDVREAYLLAEQGLGPADIERVTDGRIQRRVAWTWLRYPERFSPFLDEIALERALHGEREVYANLSSYERQVFWERSCKLSEAERAEVADRNCKYNMNLASTLGVTTDAVQASHRKARDRVRAGTGVL
jgi:hypothetical protein